MKRIATNLENGRQVSPLVVSLSFTGEPSDQNTLIANWCEKESMPWARAVVDLRIGYADAGPVFLAGCTPCYKCFAQLHLKERRNIVRNHPHCSTVAFLCNMLAPSLAEVYTQARHSHMPDGFKRYNLTTLEYNYLRRTFLPYCKCRQLTDNAECSLVEAPVSESYSHTALVYEDCVGKEHPYQTSRPTANNFVSRSLVLKPFPNSASIALAKPSPLESIGVAELLEEKTHNRLDSLTLEDLTAILFYSVGLRFVDISRSIASRWTASAGNLGSPDLFVFANGVRGLARGLYNYRALAHDLVNLDFRRASSWCDCLSSVLEGEALLCFTGSYHRLQQKYGAFGYRLVHLDAGVAFSQASLIADRSTPV
jgi:SagB-type dehydrogenase family enzyme